MEVPLAQALKQLRDELREAILDAQGQDIIFTPTGIEVELGITFATEGSAKTGLKVLALLDLSAKGKIGRESQHKIRMSLNVSDKNGQPIKVRSAILPGGLEKARK